MKLYNLGHHPRWEWSQLIYHSLPRLNMEGVILISPGTPYACIGYHQDARQEIDLDYCRQHNIPVFRREVGGGAVFLDGRQLFFQIVLGPRHPLAQLDKATLYQRMLEPVVQTYNDMGIPSRYKPINDVVTAAGRKISGTGAAQIAGSTIIVGNLIFDFDYETMSRVLRVPDEKYRDKVFKSMQENLTTVRRELGQVPPEEEAAAIMVRRFEEVLGRLELAALPAEVEREAEELLPEMTSDEWLFGRRRPGEPPRNVKIATGVHIAQRLRKTTGGLVRAALELKDDVIESASISGDFFFYPEHKLVLLADSLNGTPLAQVEPAVTAFYEREGIDSPGLTPAELAAILRGE